MSLTAVPTAMAPVRRGPVEVFMGAASGKYPDGNYLVVGGRDARASLDMPLVSTRLPKESLGEDLVILGHVHEDHTAGLPALPHAPVHVHAGDAAALRSVDGLLRHYGYGPGVNGEMARRAAQKFHYAPRPDAIAYDDGATWDLGGTTVRAIHAPGHTTGHCVLWIEPGDIAFIGDIDLSTFGPYYGDATSSLASFRRSLHLVRQLPAACWITSHHKGIVDDSDGFAKLLDRFAAALDRRSDAILAALRERPRSIDELAALRFVYPASFDDVFVPDVERRTIAQHLDELVDAGCVVRHEGLFAVR